MDAFLGYNQVRMTLEDREHTSFTIDRGTYCYKVMPFGLKNAGATYQGKVNKMFHGQMRRNIEVYVNDMIIKSKTIDMHLTNLTETFQTLKKFNICLNLAKCAFSVNSRKFLGFIVHHKGIMEM